MIRETFSANQGNHMNILKYSCLPSTGQRKALSIIMLAIMLLDSRISTAQAASPAVQAERTDTVQTFLYDAFASVATIQEEPAVDQVDPPTVQEVLLSVCQANGYGEDCAKTLLGMLWNESSNISTAIGDGGKARGYFQIHYRLHNISVECAEDLVCSADWSLNYLEAHSYPKYVNYAVQCHNSCNVKNGYAAKALRNGNSFWEKPLKIKQTAPIDLAMK